MNIYIPKVYFLTLIIICVTDDKKGEEAKRGQQKPSEKGLQLFYTLCEKVLGLMKLEGEVSF